MKKIIYIILAVVVIVVVWLALSPGKPAMAPAVNSTSTAETPSSGASSSATGVQSAYFNEKTNSGLGTYLTDQNGMTLYTFSHDTPGASNCTGTCLEKWPAYGPGINGTSTPINLPMLPAHVNTIVRLGGSLQFTWNDMPLYYYYEDKASGDVSGQGIGNAWYVVRL